ncbi:MAG: EAL domain-containing protein [Gammaproteobacteria bacterium]|nr:EAL domain-containing protein [Gammaproteobacteria bacterium]
MSKKKKQQRVVINRSVDDLQQRYRPGQQLKEHNYILQISSDDLAFLDDYRVALAAGAARFAEIYYNYLFDNPDIAGLLYTHERNGGDIGDLVRSELKFMLGIFRADKAAREAELVEVADKHIAKGAKPVWAVGAYRLFLDFLRELIVEMDISPLERSRLESVILKLVLRDLGMMSDGYWRTRLDEHREEFMHVSAQYDRIEELLTGIPHLLWSVDVKRNQINYANYPLHALYSSNLESPFPFLADTHTEDQQQLLTAWQEAVNGCGSSTEVRMSLANGAEHWYRLSLYPSLSRSGRSGQVYCLLEDINTVISERKQLEQLSTTDSLTRLPNRALWADHMNMALAASRRVPGSQVVVISLDINQFKMYNDTLGRKLGDALLREVAKRLNSVVRESDSLARLGGDQFGILLQPVSDARTAAERVITQVLDSFDVPFSCAGKQLCVSVTLGVSCFPDHGTHEEALLTSAETAMYRAKRNGLPYQFFDPGSDVSPVEQIRYSGQIQSALDNDEFELYYQPQVDLRTASITGAEALLRWQHPLEGTVLPQRIIPVAEQLGMISPITDWVLLTALRQCKAWTYHGSSVPVSVNVSARSFQSPRLVDKIQWALEEAGVSGEKLEIEITEATLMMDLERATEVLARLSDFGVTVAIDDFGTGYSSLSYLKRLPIHTLKIDQSFIMDVAFDKQDIAIVRSIIDLGHNLDYKVVAEGVETGMALDMLNSLGCDAAQGFHISHPLPEDQFSGWLSTSAWSG